MENEHTMSSTHHPFRQQYTCHHCDYDMDDRNESDPCPECGTALDVRPNDPIAGKRSRLAIGFMISAIILLPLIGSLSILFALISNYLRSFTKPQSEHVRFSYRTRKRMKLIMLLNLLWLAEIVVFLYVMEYWPGILSWW